VPTASNAMAVTQLLFASSMDWPSRDASIRRGGLNDSSDVRDDTATYG
jgi:hypothetical protein